MSLDSFLELVKTNGIEGLVIGLIVLIAVFALNSAQVVVTGNQKRIANVVLSMLLGGVSLVGTTPADALTAAIASLASAAVYELIRWAARRTLKPSAE